MPTRMAKVKRMGKTKYTENVRERSSPTLVKAYIAIT